MDVGFSWDNGYMTVNLNEFMAQCNTAKFRRLLKLMESSDNPQQVEEVRKWLDDALADIPHRTVTNDIMLRTATREMEAAEKRLKELRDKVAHHKWMASAIPRQAKTYRKCIEIMSKEG